MRPVKSIDHLTFGFFTQMQNYTVTKLRNDFEVGEIIYTTKAIMWENQCIEANKCKEDKSLDFLQKYLPISILKLRCITFHHILIFQNNILCRIIYF